MNRPEHFFVTSAGELCDTRPNACVAQGIGNVVREDYARHHREIRTGLELRSTLRAGPYAWPGGYKLYFLTDDGAALSFEAVRAELRQVLYAIRHNLRDGWRVIGCQSTADDCERTICAHTGEVIE